MDNTRHAKIDKLSMQVAATQLLVRSLISCLLEKEDAEANKSIEKLLNSITRRSELGRKLAISRAAPGDQETLVLIDKLEQSIRVEAISMVADLTRRPVGAATN